MIVQKKDEGIAELPEWNWRGPLETMHAQLNSTKLRPVTGGRGLPNVGMKCLFSREAKRTDSRT